MFKDARTEDRQRTATSFDEALVHYGEHAEDWFDGSIGSIDRRLSACDKLLHSANFTVARMDIAHSQRYLSAAEDLKQDRDALQDLRYALLTGAADRADVEGPPGWRTANEEKEAAGFWQGQGQPLANPNTGTPPMGASAGSNEFEHPAPRTNHPRWMQNQPATPKLLGGTDRRWVTLESAKFVAANTDTLDDSHELATRAHHYAQVKTSTFTPQRSAAICEAFVAMVVDQGVKSYRPAVAHTAAYHDFAAELLYLC